MEEAACAWVQGIYAARSNTVLDVVVMTSFCLAFIVALTISIAGDLVLAGGLPWQGGPRQAQQPTDSRCCCGRTLSSALVHANLRSAKPERAGNRDREGNHNFTGHVNSGKGGCSRK